MVDLFADYELIVLCQNVYVLAQDKIIFSKIILFLTLKHITARKTVPPPTKK